MTSRFERDLQEAGIPSGVLLRGPFDGCEYAARGHPLPPDIQLAHGELIFTYTRQPDERTPARYLLTAISSD